MCQGCVQAEVLDLRFTDELLLLALSNRDLHALVLHSWVGNIQDKIVAPSRKRVDHRLQVGEESYFKILLVSG